MFSRAAGRWLHPGTVEQVSQHRGSSTVSAGNAMCLSSAPSCPMGLGQERHHLVQAWARDIILSTMRTIRRYSNRKLYDTKESHYVTMGQVAAIIRAGDDI